MQLFACEICGHALYFENVRCERCGAALGFLPDRLRLGAVRAGDDDTLEPLGAAGERHRRCGHADLNGCNWLVPAGSPSPWCVADNLNRTIPDLDQPQNLERWQLLERAKRRLVYALLRLGLPVVPRSVDPEHGLAFDFLADLADGTAVMTGHAEGVVTINVAEADPVEGLRRREQLDELYRTVLGHFRHEVAHYFFDRLVRDTPVHAAFRERFGDERADYAAALQRHYEDGPAPDWQSRHVSAYAAAHPLEDWAETFAHYLHIVDTLDTAQSFGVIVDPAPEAAPGVDTEHLGNAYGCTSAQRLVDAWLPLTFALNSLNRSMGLGDLYPFVLSPPVIDKLELVRRIVAEGREVEEKRGREGGGT
ncbi:MAG: zinc-binding metallopeptidase family protein [Pseudomonadota bacterium]